MTMELKYLEEKNETTDKNKMDDSSCCKLLQGIVADAADHRAQIKEFKV